jgi:hypothetical protein
VILVLSLLAQRKYERKGTLVNPPCGYVRSFRKIRAVRLNFFRTEEIDAPCVRP